MAAGLLAAVAASAPSARAQTSCALSETLIGILQPVRDPVLEAVRETVKDVLPLIDSSPAPSASSLVEPSTLSLGRGLPDGLLPSGQGGVLPGQDVSRLVSQIEPGLPAPRLDLVPPTPAPLPPVLDRLNLDRSLASLCSALKSLGLSSGITVLSISGFTGTIMGRLDAVRGGGSDAPPPGGGNDGKMALGALQKSRPSPQPGALGPFTVYVSGTLLAGSSTDMPNAAGFSYGATSGLIGLEYSVNRYLILGIAASFTRMDTDLTSGAKTGADVIHGAVYLSYSTRQWFADALAAYGTVTLDMTRPGAVDTVRGSTDATALGLAARAGYLFDLGKLRVGPIAGISFVSAKVDGFTEAGQDPTAIKVAEQSIDSLAGSVGIRFLAPFQMGGTLLVPYLNVTLEHQFGDAKGSITTSLTQAPGSPVSLAFPVFGARDYGKIEGGLTVELAPEASLSLSGASTFARDDGHDYRLSLGLNWRF
jgi:uncharacterized protein YhjY with autotransporter beta-barrel domain